MEMARINRENVSAALFIFLVVASTGFIAATINSVQLVDAGSGAAPPDEPVPPEADRDRVSIDVSDETGQESREQQRIDAVVCIGLLRNPLVILTILAGIVGIVYAVNRRYNLATAALFSTGLVPMVMLVYFLLTNCRRDTGGGGFGGAEFIDNSGPLLEAPPVSPLLIALVFGGGMVAAVALLFASMGDEETFKPVEEETIEADTADFARAAGRAADRIKESNVAVDNAVYRAWLEMTGLLDLENPESTPPRDFAEAAIDIGLSRDDVTELTELFNEVRYGGKEARAREDRAIGVLRNIERTYEKTIEPSTDDE